MDIDPLWAIGGCYKSRLINLNPSNSWYNCMANYNKPYSSTTPKSLYLRLFLISLFFLFLFLAPRVHDPLLVSTQTLASTSSDSSSFTTVSGFRPGKPEPTTVPAGREFMVEAHEVPSGPNPISN